MLSPLENQCYTILTEACSSTYGLVLRTNDPNKARQTIYRARSLFNDPDFDKLQVRASPDDPQHELWLIRREPTVRLDEGESANKP
jgi:hypothetical protein